MTTFTESVIDIERNFQALGIPIDQPAFYDHPAFIAEEGANPGFLNNYARYVHDRNRTPEYDKHVRKVVPIIAKIYFEKLKANGRVGACIDIAGIVSRALEREGIWNSMITGSLSIRFPPPTRINPRFFWSVDTGHFAAAHAWVVAPPFFVVDVSIQLQPYDGREPKYLPQIVCEDASIREVGNLEDIVSPEIRLQLSADGVSKEKQLQVAVPGFAAFAKKFPARQVFFRGTALKYVPVETTALDGSFESISTISFEGRSAYDVYVDEVLELVARAK